MIVSLDLLPGTDHYLDESLYIRGSAGRKALTPLGDLPSGPLAFTADADTDDGSPDGWRCILLSG